MEQFERLVVFDAKATAEPGAVRWKAVKDFGAGTAQPLAQGADVRAEMREVTRDRQRAFGADKKACRLTLLRTGPR